MIVFSFRESVLTIESKPVDPTSVKNECFFLHNDSATYTRPVFSSLLPSSIHFPAALLFYCLQNRAFSGLAPTLSIDVFFQPSHVQHHDRELLNEASFAAVGSPGETPRNFSPINRKNGSANTSTTVANNNGGNNDRDDVHTAPSSAQSKPDAFTLSPTSSFKITTSPSGRRRRSGSDDGIGWIAKGLAEAGAATEAAIPAPASLDPLLPSSEMRGPSSLPSPTRKTCLGSVSAVTHEANSTDGHSVEWRSRRYAVAASAPATPVSVAPHASSSSVLTAASSALTRAAATNPKSSAVSPNSTPPISDSQKAVALSPHEGQSSAGSGGGGFSGGGSGFLASGGGRSVTARPPSSPAGGSSNQGGGEAPPR